MDTPDYTSKDVARFWSKIDSSGECWNWIAGKNSQGYGSFSHNNKTKRAHRVAYELSNGKIANDLQVLHTCDNPSCCNPKHLILGTHQNNMDEMTQKGRKIGKNGKRKLTKRQKQNIAKLHFENGISFTQLAKKYNVTVRYIALIIGIAKSNFRL